MTTCCIVVIGHVDHGKTALVRALSGIETDRLVEEKARGLSITPGFAHCTYPGGTIDLIDAPGHEDFIQAMISGTTGAEAALVVISAVEGIGAQTLEHLSIAEFLGITSGVIAVTKSDLLTQPEHAACLKHIRAAMSQTPLADAPLVLCSALTGDGIDEVHQHLQALLPPPKDAPSPLLSFLPIDRVFSMPGQGTIVTGTLLGRDLTPQDTVVLQPSGKAVTIRGLQSRGVKRDVIHAGERMAANLRGIGVSDIARGAVLCASGAATSTVCMDVHLDLLPDTSRNPKHLEAVRVLFGTSNEVASVRIFGGKLGATATCCLAQLRFKKPVVGYAGQRAVLRRLSPSETIGGAVFLDPQATPAKSGDTVRLQILDAVKTRQTLNIARALSHANGGAVRLSDVARLSQKTAHSIRTDLGEAFQILDGDLIAAKDDIETCKSDVLGLLAAYHTRYPLRTMAPRTTIVKPETSPALLQYVEAVLLANGQICQNGNKIAASNHDPIPSLSPDQQIRLLEIETVFRLAALTPPMPESLLQNQTDMDLLELLKDTGRLVSLRNISLKQTLLVHTDTMAAAAVRLSLAFSSEQSFTTSDARNALATSRRIIVPMLEHFDSCGVTIRNGNTRHMADKNPVPLRPATC